MRIGSFVKSIVAATALLGFVAAAPSAAFACGVFPTGFNASDGVLAMVANGSSQVTLTSQGNAGSSRQGMLFYNRTTNSLYVCDGSVWQRLWGRGTDAAFNPASIGTGLYGGTFLQTSTGTNDNATALTFGYNTSGSVGAFPAAGIYVQTGAAYGSRMFFGTTNSFGSVLNRMTIDQNGNVGIATTAPASRLFVQETGDVRQLVVRDWVDISASSGGQALFASNMYRGGAANDFRYANTHASIGATGIAINHPAWRDISFISDGTSNPTGATTLNTTFTPTTNMIIKTGGNVGIGTTSPAWLLDVRSNTDTVVSSYSYGTAVVPHFIGHRARGTQAAPTQVLSGDALASFQGRTAVSSASWPGMSIVATENFSGTAQGAAIVFNTTPNTTVATTERMRIDHNGNVMVGVTSSNYRFFVEGTSNNTARIGLLSIGRSGTEYPSVGYNVRYGGTAGAYTYDQTDTASMIRFNSGQVQTFTAASGTAGAAISFTQGPFVAQGGNSWTNGSDRRLKENIQPYSVLEKLKDYQAVSFDWKQSGLHDLGVIAQDIYKIFPEVVVKGDDLPELDASGKGKWGVQYDKLGALALQAAKELQAENAALKAQLEAMDARLKALESK